MNAKLKAIRRISWSFAAAAALSAAASGLTPARASDNINRAILGGLGGGLLGGLAAGVIMQPRPVYAAPVYAAPVYAHPPRYEPICRFERRRVWLNPYEFTYRRVEICD